MSRRSRSCPLAAPAVRCDELRLFEGPVRRVSIAAIEISETPVTRAQYANPYLVIKVDKALIRDHNDLSNPRIAEFISQLILVASQPPNLAVRKTQRQGSPAQ